MKSDDVRWMLLEADSKLDVLQLDSATLHSHLLQPPLQLLLPPHHPVEYDMIPLEANPTKLQSLSMLHQPKDRSKNGNPFVHPIKRAHLNLNASIQSVRSQSNLPTLPCSTT